MSKNSYLEPFSGTEREGTGRETGTRKLIMINEKRKAEISQNIPENGSWEWE